MFRILAIRGCYGHFAFQLSGYQLITNYDGMNLLRSPLPRVLVISPPRGFVPVKLIWPLQILSPDLHCLIFEGFNDLMESKGGKKKSSSSKSIFYEAPLGYSIEDIRPNGGIKKFRSAAYSNCVRKPS
ncbi:hypothetical protein Nepgr_003678 [Nepenthes gracilis]|uniref:Uncharacterized protein n=1 Tax=Nepenthes gracilis TaxID=150966 RepID=A0AAD3RZY8_NEPGR|nr:hypothetical protein Nepgr_003678 [Nepenthes gracilis]